MRIVSYIRKQLVQISEGGRAELNRKIGVASRKVILLPANIILCAFAIPVVLILRLIRPWLLIRWGRLFGSRIGHFAFNTELCLLRYESGLTKPRQKHLDVFFISGPICNKQLATMWKRALPVLPSWILSPIDTVNQYMPGRERHIIIKTFADRDIDNLSDKFPPHLQFTDKEDARGQAGLKDMGIPEGSRFVCLLVRDNAYLNQFSSGWSYHNYRDCNVQNYLLAAEELAERGYFVIRMGALVREPMKSDHPRVIDYATNGLRSDFMDIYLGSKCDFAISTSSGWDWIPGYLFRKPVVFTNFVPLGYMLTYSSRFINISKKYYSTSEKRELTLREIFARNLGFIRSGAEYSSNGIQLVENSPEELRDVVVEMAECLNGTWQAHPEDQVLQSRFWKLFPSDAVDETGKRLHGEIRSRFGASFLRKNRSWLE